MTKNHMENHLIEDSIQKEEENNVFIINDENNDQDIIQKIDDTINIFIHGRYYRKIVNMDS